jgi:hypothetical protein
MLKTERNTPTMGARVERAFRKSTERYRAYLPEDRGYSRRNAAGNIGKVRRVDSFFEHGQWWITDLDTGDQWAVNDAEGSEANGVFDGFCFEQVSHGEED